MVEVTGDTRQGSRVLRHETRRDPSLGIISQSGQSVYWHVKIFGPVPNRDHVQSFLRHQNAFACWLGIVHQSEFEMY